MVYCESLQYITKNMFFLGDNEEVGLENSVPPTLGMAEQLENHGPKPSLEISSVYEPETKS